MRHFISDWPVCLEDAHGNRVPVRGSCSLGRSTSNHIAVDDQTVSRRHALIQLQGEHEYWLVDFGSSNGTYLNGQRISRPTRLCDGDALRIGGAQYTFRLSDPHGSTLSTTMLADKTVMDVRCVPCWLLVADIVNSTQLTTELPGDEVSRVIGRWLAQCKEVIEQCGGRINQFLGDGFLALWSDGQGVEQEVDKAARALTDFQSQQSPAFRFAIHLGPVMVGGMAVGEEENLSGSAVYFAFRMEKLAGSLGEQRLLSAEAQKRLESLVRAKNIGRHRLHGFTGKFPFYAL